MNRLLFLIVVGLGGAAILVSLGVWQVQRLAEKQAIIADIEARIDGPVQPLPEDPEPLAHSYLPVKLDGTFAGDTLRVLVSQKNVGAGYRLITPFETGTLRLMVDRGFVASDDKGIATPDGRVTVTGNLQWPDEVDGFTPAPDPDLNIWYARDLPAMAAALNASPILLVAREVTGDDPVVAPLPVNTARIPNHHLQYAITWFSLAAVWLAMSALFLRRQSRDTSAES